MRDNFSSALILFLFAFMGMTLGIFLVPAMEKVGIQFTFGAVMTFAAFVILPAIVLYLFRQRKTFKSAASTEKPSEVGFVVDTFHELVGKLKEKEKELERLRSFAEEKAVSIEAYNDNILQSVHSGVISIDNAMKIKSINQAGGHLLGINVKDAIDRHMADVFKEPLLTLLQDGRTISRGEYQYVSGDKRSLWLGVTISELKNSAGERIGSILVFTDLTDVKALQLQVELKERLSQLGEMSAGIAHELRNSMSVISGYAKLLGKKTDTSGQPTVDAIIEEIGSMDKIISELLAFAKPTVLNKESVNLNELIKEAAFAAAGGNDKINISFNYKDPVTASADAALLRHALSNLFINAVEAMPGGGNIDIGLRRVSNKVEIVIRDTGLGMPEDTRRKIFLPFYTTKPGGIGFGLALVQKIIVSHGGTVEVESKEGEGSVFTVTIPDVI